MTENKSAVKELREKTGAGMLDCKKALDQNNGDIEAAIDWLRKKGLAAAAKKADRVAAEGLIAVAVDSSKAALLEINAETDFVARNELFQDFARKSANIALKENITDLEILKKAKFDDTRTIEEQLIHLIATIGENMSLRRLDLIDANGGSVGVYVHNAISPNLGKIGVVVVVKGDADFAKKVAMHVAASSPFALNSEGVDQKIIARERAIAEDKASQSGKPADIVNKMVEGAIQKFLKDVSLLDQPFVIDPSKTVSQAASEAKTEIISYNKYVLGEGIEKVVTDFAAEVASMAK